MLLLSRKCGERIVIGVNIEVRVVSIRGRRVKLGVCAPGDVAVRREELCVRVEPWDAREDNHPIRKPLD